MDIRRRLERLEARGLLAGQVSWEEYHAAEQREMARSRVKMATASSTDDDEHTAAMRQHIRGHPVIIEARAMLADDSPEQEKFDAQVVEAWRRQQGIAPTTPAQAQAAKAEILRRLDALAKHSESDITPIPPHSKGEDKHEY